MNLFDRQASDNLLWNRHRARTDLMYQSEQGNAFTASDRFEIAGNSVEYLEFRVPEGVVVRIYDRVMTVDANTFNVDLCTATSFTPGTTELSHTNMQLSGRLPDARIYRGVTNVVGLEVKEYTMVPAERGNTSAGAFSTRSAYRTITHTTVPSLLRIENTQNGDNQFCILVLWSELPN